MISKNDQSILNFLGAKICDINSSDSKEYWFINNPDDTVRWLFPRDLKTPTFLNFYNISNLRARVFALVIKLLFFFRLSKLVKSGSVFLSIEKDSILKMIVGKNKTDNYSIFTGTKGENRKAIIELNVNKKTTLFIKVALTKSSKILVTNEIEKLEFLKKYSLKNLAVPKVLSSNKEQGVIEITNIKPIISKQLLELNNLHFVSLNEIAKLVEIEIKWNEFKMINDCKQSIITLKNQSFCNNGLNKNRILDLGDKVLKVILKLEIDKKVRLGLSHGDFTPWNMYFSKDNKIHLFDWELSEFEMPLLFDAFHYVFQSSIMINRLSYKELMIHVKKSLNEKDCRLMITEYNIDINKNYAFYLIYTISYYLKKYTVQEELHQQVFWMLNIWEEAIDDVLKSKGQIFKKVHNESDNI